MDGVVTLGAPVNIAYQSIWRRRDFLSFLQRQASVELKWEQSDDLTAAVKSRLESYKVEAASTKDLMGKVFTEAKPLGLTHSHAFVQLGSEVLSVNRENGEHAFVDLAVAQQAIAIHALLP